MPVDELQPEALPLPPGGQTPAAGFVIGLRGFRRASTYDS